LDIHYFNDLFESIKGKRIVVLGDSMIDSYLKGKVERISPEAPVPILDIKTRENRLGGAANVALNIKAMGATAVLCSVVGDDNHGDEFEQLMKSEGLETSLLSRLKERKTTIKHRLISGTQQLMRVDEEDRSPVESAILDELLSKLQKYLDNNKVDGLIIQDYNKGLLTSSFNHKIIELCKSHRIFTAVDPKKENFLSFKNCDLFKPNLKQLREGLNLELNKLNKNELDEASDALRDQMNCSMVMVTLSEKGIYGSNDGNSFVVPAKVRDIADVSGAGDTVIAVATLFMSVGVEMEMAARIANLAGGLVCEMVGVVPVNREQLLQEAIMSIK